MIFCPTKKTSDTYSLALDNEEKIKSSNNLPALKEEIEDDLYKWGMKIFYIDGKKCVQVMNFASKLTIIFLDFRKDMMKNIPSLLLEKYLYDIYFDNIEMLNYIQLYFKGHQDYTFCKLNNRTVIGSLNQCEYYFESLYSIINDSIQNGIVNTGKVNYEFASDEIFSINKEYVFSKDEFERLLTERFK